LTKMSTKTKTGDGWGMMSGVLNNGFWNPASFFPPQLISKTKFSNDFLRNCQFGPKKGSVISRRGSQKLRNLM
jgi:hypothetical protein